MVMMPQYWELYSSYMFDVFKGKTDFLAGRISPIRITGVPPSSDRTMELHCTPEDIPCRPDKTTRLLYVELAADSSVQCRARFEKLYWKGSPDLTDPSPEPGTVRMIPGGRTFDIKLELQFFPIAPPLNAAWPFRSSSSRPLVCR